MTSIVKMTPLLGGVGGEGESSWSAPHCYLLQVDECHFLLDCGWRENISPREQENYFNAIKKVGRRDGEGALFKAREERL